VCISGLNVGIFAAVAGWLAKRAGLLQKGRAIACIVSITVFMLVCAVSIADSAGGDYVHSLLYSENFNRNSFR
jgi:predicted membrane metal-binding protein